MRFTFSCPLIEVMATVFIKGNDWDLRYVSVKKGCLLKEFNCYFIVK